MMRTGQVKVNLLGGIGNQLFCYFAGMAHAIKFKKEPIFNLATANASLPSSATLEELNLYGKFVREDYSFWRKSLIYRPKKIGFDEKILSSRPISHMEGYFQSFIYFDIFMKEYPKWEATVSNPGDFFLELLPSFQEEKPIVLHLRRGDYRKLRDSFGLISESFYLNCLAKAINDHGERQVLIFGDELAANIRLSESLQKEGLSASVVDPSNRLNAVDTLILMSHAGINIIGNSTFGWWAARLNRNPIDVYAPSKWFKAMKDPTNLTPPSWKIQESSWE